MKRLLANLGRSSVLWGLVAAFAYYFAIHRGFIQNETIVRYSVGHPVEYATIAMFWIGLCDLVFKIAKTRRERRALRRGALFPPKRAEKEPLSNAQGYLDAIAKARDVRGDSTYLARLADALEFLKFGGSSDELDQELRNLADDAQEARDADYGMTRSFIWAIPILGFLGTVLGITAALGSLDLTQLNATSEKLADGLKVAFDTTALSLSLVFALYFAQFFSRKQDATLARAVARLVDSELKGRFYDDRALDRDASPTADVGAALARAVDESARRMTDAWTRALQSAATEIADAVDKRLCQGSDAWTQTLADAQTQFVQGALQPALDETLRRVAKFDALEDKVAQEIEALRTALAAAADLASLEDRLALSLEQVAQTQEFEKTLSNLSATVCLLNSKLADLSRGASFRDDRRASKRNESLAALRALDLVGAANRELDDERDDGDDSNAARAKRSA